MDWGNMILAAIGGGGLTSIVLAIINKIRNNGERVKDGDSHLKQLSEIMSGTIKDVQQIYQESIKDLREEREHSNKLTELAHQREDRLILIIEDNNKAIDALQRKGRKKNEIIQSARKCELLKDRPYDDCIVLQKYDDYNDCKQDCKLINKDKDVADN